MKTWPYNYHMHTPHGDGHSSAAEHAAEACSRGMTSIGFSEHAPLGEDISWTIAADRVEEYRQELRELRQEYKGRLEIYAGLESDWWPERPEWYERIQPESWNYLIGSVHFVSGQDGDWAIDSSALGFERGLHDVFHQDIRAGCDAFFSRERQAALSGRFDILAHCDL